MTSGRGAWLCRIISQYIGYGYYLGRGVESMIKAKHYFGLSAIGECISKIQPWNP